MTGRYYALDNNPLHLCPVLASALVCLVVEVSDGDTLTARCGEPGQYEQVKVRLQGIDAPELFSAGASEFRTGATVSDPVALR